MRVASLTLKNFKRFTELVIREIPESAKLVVVVGPNGSGKSSLFDALLHWYRMQAGFGLNNDPLYYQKDKSKALEWRGFVEVTLHGGGAMPKGSLYIRTAYRNDPDFSINDISRQSSPSDGIRIGRSIENDQAVSENYRRLVYDTMSAVYSPENDAKTVQALREELVGELRNSMLNVFGDLVLNNLSDPLQGGAFFFEKGSVPSYHYKNLSGGEKAAFDLLLDLHVKKKFFANAIYCIDEMETHLHTRVQGQLLREMVRILPDECQMWLTTHSLGVLRAAQEMIMEHPSSVCLIDFEGLEADAPCEITPSNLGRATWDKFLSVALAGC